MDGLTGWLGNYAVSFEAHSAKNGRCLGAHGKCWGVRRSSQSGGLAKMALDDEMPWTPNTTNLQPRAPGLASVWEQVSAASGIQTCFKLCVELPTAWLRLSVTNKKRAAIAGRPRGFGVVIDEARVAAQLGYFSSGSDRSCKGRRRGRRCSRPGPWRGR